MGKSASHFVAGALAGTAEHCGMFPVDTIKTHMQAHREGMHSMTSTARNVFHTGGFRAFFRGLTALIAGAAPSHAVYFASYEICKKQLGGNIPGTFALSVSAATATILGDAVISPMDAVKQRLQLNSVHYQGTRDCIRNVIKKEGVRALYAGYTTTIIMNVPFHAIYLNIYERLIRILKKDKREYSGILHFAAGGGAGMVAGGLTNPLDVARTRLQTQGNIVGEGHIHYKGLVHTLATIWRGEGVRGMSRGMGARMLFHSFSASILWTTYEYFKFIFGAT
uniref:Mitochondrial carrier protein n=1 Tax=Arcella intermedia TaxID=1963864 RepID=A0A6B2LDM0_9EUKA